MSKPKPAPKKEEPKPAEKKDEPATAAKEEPAKMDTDEAAGGDVPMEDASADADKDQMEQ